MKKIGMVGIGMMGHGIASNIVKRGYGLGLFEHPGNQPLDSLKAAGAEGFTTLPRLAAYSDVIILVLTGSAQVEAVLAGPGGLLEAMPQVALERGHDPVAIPGTVAQAHAWPRGCRFNPRCTLRQDGPCTTDPIPLTAYGDALSRCILTGTLIAGLARAPAGAAP